MNFTAREDYGLKAVLELALRANQGPVQSKEIASSQQIPEQFLEQLLGALRRGGLVKSVRGAAGGYLLAKRASSISVGDVLKVLSGPLVPSTVLGEGFEGGNTSNEGIHGVFYFWSKLAEAITDVADNLTIQDLADAQMSADAQAGYAMHI